MRIQAGPITTTPPSFRSLRSEADTPAPAQERVDSVRLNHARPVLAGVGAGALAAAAGALVHPIAGSLMGGAVGLAVGAYIGRKWDELQYDHAARKEQKRTRRQQRDAERSREGQPPPPPMTPLGKADLRAVRAVGMGQRLYDGFDASRDIAGLYTREGSAHEPFRVDVEVANLRPAAEQVALDTKLEFRWGNQGQLTLDIDNNTEVHLEGQPAVGVPVRHNEFFNRVQVGVAKELLRARGWHDGEPLHVRAVTRPEDEIREVAEISARTDERGVSSGIFRWEGKTVYYAVTDRFHNGDPSNDGVVDPKDPEKFHGGDWQGVIDKLDYLQGLSVDCIWLSPPYLNERNYDGIANRNAPPKDGFHGYWPMDFEKVDPNWGDMAKLRELTEKAHERGMKVMLDVVVNHTAYGHSWPQDPAKKDWFNWEGNISGLGQWQQERGNLCYLPDLNQDNPEVSRHLIDAHKMWLDQGVDAFRVDAVRHVPETFLRDFDREMRATKPGYFAVGEVFQQDPNYVAGYQNRTMDSMFDFPLAYAIRNVFAGDPSRTLKERLALFRKMLFAQPQEAIRGLLKSHKSESMQALSNVLSQDSLYDNPGRLGTLVDNHDMIRFMSDAGGRLDKLELALAFLYAVRGTPHVYYGTEVGMAGVGNANRNDMEWGKNPEFTDTVRALAQARAGSEALQQGKQVELNVADETYAFSRMLPDEEVVCVFNNGDTAQIVPLKLHEESQVPAGAAFADMFGGETLSRNGDGELVVSVPPGGYRYLQWKR
jgi:alpha-amylase